MKDTGAPRPHYRSSPDTFIQEDLGMKNPFEKHLGKEDLLQREVIKYLALQYPDSMVVHIPNEGKRTPFERYKFKTLGGVSGMPDIMIFDPKGIYSGLALELKVGYNKPTENQERCLEALKMRNWASYWCNNFDKAKEIIDYYFNAR